MNKNSYYQEDEEESLNKTDSVDFENYEFKVKPYQSLSWEQFKKEYYQLESTIKNSLDKHNKLSMSLAKNLAFLE